MSMLIRRVVEAQMGDHWISNTSTVLSTSFVKPKDRAAHGRLSRHLHLPSVPHRLSRLKQALETGTDKRTKHNVSDRADNDWR